MAALPLADGPAMYFGATIMTFALPYGAFIVGALVLFFLFRARHSGPKLKYLATYGTTSVSTKEPGPAPAPSVAAQDAGPKAEAQPAKAADSESKEGEE